LLGAKDRRRCSALRSANAAAERTRARPPVVARFEKRLSTASRQENWRELKRHVKSPPSVISFLKTVQDGVQPRKGVRREARRRTPSGCWLASDSSCNPLLTCHEKTLTCHRDVKLLFKRVATNFKSILANDRCSAAKSRK